MYEPENRGGVGFIFYGIAVCDCVVYTANPPPFSARGLWGRVDAVADGVCNWFGT